MLSFPCPHCAKALHVKDDFTGTKAKCPSCGQLIVVPATSVKLAAAAASQPAPPVRNGGPVRSVPVPPTQAKPADLPTVSPHVDGGEAAGPGVPPSDTVG